MATPIGQTVSHYKILERLGGGGMGVVYKAEDSTLKRTVALKFLPPDLTRDPEAKERFIHEAQAASALEHTNICSVHEIGEHDGQSFIVMGYYEGETLKKKIESGPLDPGEAVEIASQVAHGLARAHEAGITHRDIKPANIVVTTRGEVKILDFGLAKLTGRTLLTKSGTTIGTAAYMSPEQARGEQVDHRTDIWSLGVVFYEMLTGRRPFASDYEQAVIYSILNEEPKLVTALNNTVPTEIAKVVHKALAKNPEDRYQVIGEMLSALEPRGGGELPVSNRPSTSGTRKKQMVAFGLALLAVVVISYLLLSPRKTEVRKIAVLPFVDTSKDSTIAGVFDGLTEDVITNIGQLSHTMKVISFNGVVGYKEKQMTPMKAGEELGVDAIVACRVYRQGGEYSFHIEVVSVRDNTSISHERISSSLTEITVLPKRMAAQIIKSFGGTVTDAEVSASARQQTKNLDAYRLYQQGNYHYHRLAPDELRMSIQYYQKALEKDPDYALAYGGIALSYMQLGSTEAVPFKQIVDSCVIAAKKALALDENVPEALLAITTIRYYEHVPGNTRAELEHVISLNPSYADAVHMYGHWLGDHRQFDKALQMMHRSVEFEPLNPHFQYCLAQTYAFARQWDESRVEFQKLFELDSTYAPGAAGYYCTLLSYFANGDSAGVVEYFKTDLERAAATPGSIDYLVAAIYVNAYGGRKAEAMKYLRQMHSVKTAEAMQFAFLYAALSDKGESVRWLEKAFERREGMFMAVNNLPQFDFLIGDPPFEALMKKAGFRE